MNNSLWSPNPAAVEVNSEFATSKFMCGLIAEETAATSSADQFASGDALPSVESSLPEMQ